MSAGFGTRPGDLGAAAERFDEAARGVADALAALRSTLGGLGDHLGADEQGRAFAAQYDPKAGEGVAAIGRESEALRSLGAALRDAAREFVADDAGGAVALRPPGG